MNSIIGVPTTNVLSAIITNPQILTTVIIVILIGVILFSGLSSVKSYSGLHKNIVYLDSYLKPLLTHHMIALYRFQ